MRRAFALSEGSGRVLLTNDLGEFSLQDAATVDRLVAGSLTADHPSYFDLEARGLLTPDGPQGLIPDTVRRTRKSFVVEGPSLHIFVVTLRCDHTCTYCQVSRAATHAAGYDMQDHHALLAVDRVFESDAPALTIEFQGGEPALRFELIEKIVTRARSRANSDGRPLRFTMATTLHHLSSVQLEFCRENKIHLSTSLDGPQGIHDAQRPGPQTSTWEATLAALARSRAILGIDGIAALPTITRATMDAPEALIDTYVEHGFRSIFLRPMMPFGFGKKSAPTIAAGMGDFLTFYERALNHILALNKAGVAIEETTASIMLRHILTPFHSGYMDLRSPSGAGLGVLVYNYDGKVYPSDEARMAARLGDERFSLGDVSTPLDELLTSPAMRWLSRGAIAENQRDCAECAFVPYCGADPVMHAILDGEPDAPRAGSLFCRRAMGIFQILFRLLDDRDPETLRTFHAWGLGRDRNSDFGWYAL